MESGKQGSSETSSEENDRSTEQAVNGSDETAGTKRSYECTYCKRGFTNAQALGGHMNIHRKDRAKAKQHGNTTTSFSSFSNNNEATSPLMTTPFSSQSAAAASWYRPVVDAHLHHQSFPYGYSRGYDQSDYNNYYNQFASRSTTTTTTTTTQSLTMNDELLGANLSLRMSSSRLEDHDATRDSVSDEVLDLELRLGHG